jgi:hypothetical protein
MSVLWEPLGVPFSLVVPTWRVVSKSTATLGVSLARDGLNWRLTVWYCLMRYPSPRRPKISVPHLRVNREGKIQGRGHPQRDALGWAIPVLWPVKLATLPASAQRPALKGKTRITLRLLEDVEVPATIAAARTTSSLMQNQRLAPSSRGIHFREPFYESSKKPSVAGATTARLQGQSRGLAPRDLSEDPVEPQLTWLVLKNGTSYLVRDYWLEFGKLQCVTLDGSASCSHCRGWIWMRLYALTGSAVWNLQSVREIPSLRGGVRSWDRVMCVLCLNNC